MGLKFFNVYGPHETHKGRMASVIYHAFHQIKATGALKLFQSHHTDFKDGEQLRDFVFVDDVVAVCLYFYNVINTQKATVNLNGIYNLGTGQARTFNDLGKAVFSAMGKPEAITYIPIPEDIRDKYQYFTEANMAKLKRAGFSKEFTALEDGVQAYVRFLEANTD
jgi:ADP-L-glycero-D-manno-heptose 6-epimerase